MEPSQKETENNESLRKEQCDSNCKENKCKFNESAIYELKDEISMLRDLFSRRLMEDKQKVALISNLEDSSKFVFIEPFLYDLILLLDRIEKSEDEMIRSVYDELSEILFRRGLERIKLTDTFNPKTNKIIRVITDNSVEQPTVKSIVRQGYAFSGKVIRPIEIILEKPLEQ